MRKVRLASWKYPIYGAMGFGIGGIIFAAITWRLVFHGHGWGLLYLTWLTSHLMWGAVCVWGYIRISFKERLALETIHEHNRI